MTPERELALPPAPISVGNAAGHPAFGTYRGELPEVDFSRLSGRYHLSAAQRLLKHKRWVYSLVVTPEVIAAFAIVDLGYTSNAFAVAVDLRDEKVLFDGGYLGLPGPLAKVGDRPGEGLEARFRTVGARLACERTLGRERYDIDVDILHIPFVREGLRWHGGILAGGGNPPPLTVISPVDGGGVVNVTQKRAGLPAVGRLHTAGRTFDLSGGVAGMDYTNGYLARHTAWRWALGLGRLSDGTPIGLNLVEGFNDGDTNACENALWIGNRLVRLGSARFQFNPVAVMNEWRLTTEDGAVDLRFRPIHVHREERDYRVVRSHFVQPFGRFEGTVKVDGRSLPVQLAGVAEDQDILW
jgi:hypothetical protein